MRRLPLNLIIALIALTAPPALAAQTTLQMVIDLPGNAERNLINYRCDETTDIAVDYLNAAPNFLAILEVEGQELIFTSVVSASGVKYVSNQYVWWTKGAEANLFDELAGEDADPIASCIEVLQTP